MKLGLEAGPRSLYILSLDNLTSKLDNLTPKLDNLTPKLDNLTTKREAFPKN